VKLLIVIVLFVRLTAVAGLPSWHNGIGVGGAVYSNTEAHFTKFSFFNYGLYCHCRGCEITKYNGLTVSLGEGLLGVGVFQNQQIHRHLRLFRMIPAIGIEAELFKEQKSFGVDFGPRFGIMTPLNRRSSRVELFYSYRIPFVKNQLYSGHYLSLGYSHFL